jgi:hypothetical protein
VKDRSLLSEFFKLHFTVKAVSVFKKETVKGGIELNYCWCSETKNLKDIKELKTNSKIMFVWSKMMTREKYKNHIKLPNQGNILGNLMLLNKMQNSVGYADENGYFTKKMMAEVGINSYTITSGGKMGDDIIDLINDPDIDEIKNKPLQQAKMRMQILRVLGLVATDYSSEIYSITDFGKKVLERAFPLSQDTIPDYSLLFEALMGITTSCETYNHNCTPDFNCYLGYNICYAFQHLNYMISVDEMCAITTYSSKEIPEFIEDVKKYRINGVKFPDTHKHFPKTMKGTPILDRTNLTRTINQILRLCGVIESNDRRINGFHYYVCTKKGKEYINRIMRGIKAKKFITSYEFRRKRIIEQKKICASGYYNILNRCGYEVDSLDDKIDSLDDKIVFSPYQILPEGDVDRLLDRTPRKPPIIREEQLQEQEFTNSILGNELRLKPTYISQEDYDTYIRTHSSKNNIITEIINVRDNNANVISDNERKEELIKELMERHKLHNKSEFYPFVHSLFMAMGLGCRGEVDRIDGFFEYNNIIVPAEIKSYTETQAYNIEGARQALENKILVYKEPGDLNYASLLIGYRHPVNTVEIQKLIEAAYEEWGIKIIAFDLLTVITMCVNSIWSNKKVDFDSLLAKYGIADL